jgi:hypothetical protein
MGCHLILHGLYPLKEYPRHPQLVERALASANDLGACAQHARECADILIRVSIERSKMPSRNSTYRSEVDGDFRILPQLMI